VLGWGGVPGVCGWVWGRVLEVPWALAALRQPSVRLVSSLPALHAHRLPLLPLLPLPQVANRLQELNQPGMAHLFVKAAVTLGLG
jgi:hypothetical protein